MTILANENTMHFKLILVVKFHLELLSISQDIRVKGKLAGEKE